MKFSPVFFDTNQKTIRGEIIKKLCTSEADSRRCLPSFVGNQILQPTTKASLANFHV